MYIKALFMFVKKQFVLHFVRQSQKVKLFIVVLSGYTQRRSETIQSDWLREGVDVKHSQCCTPSKKSK